MKSSVAIQLRVSPEEARVLARGARQLGIKLSSYVRFAALTFCEHQLAAPATAEDK